MRSTSPGIRIDDRNPSRIDANNVAILLMQRVPVAHDVPADKLEVVREIERSAYFGPRQFCQRMEIDVVDRPTKAVGEIL